MKYFFIVIINSFFLVTYGMEIPKEGPKKHWTAITLPYNYTYPSQTPFSLTKTSHYSVSFPVTKQQWYATAKEEGCPNNPYRTTSNRWLSDKHDKISGISFKGLIKKNYATNSMANQFAYYFHEDKCYNGGDEYGWVFPEKVPADKPQGLFYLCGNCNILPEELKKKELPPHEIEKQKEKWCNWPDPTNTGRCKTIDGDCAAVEEALKHPEISRYWNITVRPDSNFLIELIDPKSYKSLQCIIEKPQWIKNLYEKNGYITLNAQKKDDPEKPKNSSWDMVVDEVKILK